MITYYIYSHINSVALVRKRTIPNERLPLLGEVSANFCGKRVLRGQRNEFPRLLISVFYTAAATFSFKQFLNCPHEAEWTPFQTPYLSENLVEPKIKPETSESVARNSDD
jgi:hypothetical protein